MKKMIIAVTSVIALVGLAYYVSPIHTVPVFKDNVIHNYPFAGSVVLKSGDKYRIGTHNCVKLWLGETDLVIHEYRWFK
jgi:hypothetical protein